MAWDMDGCGTEKYLAALVTFSSSATFWKYLSCNNSIEIPPKYCFHDYATIFFPLTQEPKSYNFKGICPIPDFIFYKKIAG
jgi:hypothetical protein